MIALAAFSLYTKEKKRRKERSSFGIMGRQQRPYLPNKGFLRRFSVRGSGSPSLNIYLVLDYGDIKIGAFNAVGTSNKEVALAAQAPKMNITTLASLVNTQDGDLLKYFPDEFLSASQKQTKMNAL